MIGASSGLKVASNSFLPELQERPGSFNSRHTMQVQDVGLIFLSAMASAIVHEGSKKGTPESEILGTTLLTLTASTFVVGLLIIIVGEEAPLLL